MIGKRGKKSDPQINFQDAKLLADVLPTFAKKIAIQLDIYDLHQNLIQQLNDIFRANEGDHQVSFDVLEIERTKKSPVVTEEIISVKSEIPLDIDVEVDIDNLDVEAEMEEEVVSNAPVEIEENRVVTKLSMPSRKLKIKISKELLEQLEKLQVNFKLN